jgi:hypothetical protein
MAGCGVKGVEPATTALVLRRLFKEGFKLTVLRTRL